MDRFLCFILLFISFQCRQPGKHIEGNDQPAPDSIELIKPDTAPVDLGKLPQRKVLDTAVLITDSTEILVSNLKQELKDEYDTIEFPKCNHWHLDSGAVVKIIRKCQPISTYYLHYGYNVLNCSLTGDVVIGGKQFKIDINGGSYFSLYDGDTSYLFGDEDKKLMKYFITSNIYDEYKP